MGSTTLLILAAGMGSRYGGLKQLDAIGPNGETIIDYSVYDAIRAGFSKVVFVIRKDFEDAFRLKVSNKFANAIEVVHVFQTLETGYDELPCPENRVKPWGTGHAILAAKNTIRNPFAVINADDYYGADAFEQAHSFLQGLNDPYLGAMVGYGLSKTLSKYGHVNRGICSVDENYFLINVMEREKIEYNGDEIVYNSDGEVKILDANAIASMNFWLFHPGIFNELEQAYKQFLVAYRTIPKSEFYIPTFVDEQIKSELLQIIVLLSEDSWYGVTYKKDKEAVMQAIKSLHTSEKYPKKLKF